MFLAKNLSYVLLRVLLRHIHHIWFQNNALDLSVMFKTMHHYHRPLIPQPVMPANDAEPGDIAVIVQYIKPFHTSNCQQTRDNSNFPRGTYVHFKISIHKAAFDEVLIDLRFSNSSWVEPNGSMRWCWVRFFPSNSCSVVELLLSSFSIAHIEKRGSLSP